MLGLRPIAHQHQPPTQPPLPALGSTTAVARVERLRQSLRQSATPRTHPERQQAPPLGLAASALAATEPALASQVPSPQHLPATFQAHPATRYLPVGLRPPLALVYTAAKHPLALAPVAPQATLAAASPPALPD